MRAAVRVAPLRRRFRARGLSPRPVRATAARSECRRGKRDSLTMTEWIYPKKLRKNSIGTTALMFTGIIEEVGKIGRIEQRGENRRNNEAATLSAKKLEPADSIAVTAVC